MFLEGDGGLRPQVDSICLPCTLFFSFQKALRVLHHTLKTLQAYYLLASLINCTLTSCQDAIHRCQRETGREVRQESAEFQMRTETWQRGQYEDRQIFHYSPSV